VFTSYRTPRGSKVVRVVVELSPAEALLLTRLARWQGWWGGSQAGSTGRCWPGLLSAYIRSSIAKDVACMVEDFGDDDPSDFGFTARRWLVGRRRPTQ